MANIVELREMSDDKLNEMLDNAREEQFNLRFQHAISRLDNFNRLKEVRREMAQVRTVLHMRRLALESALAQPEIAAAVEARDWVSRTRFDYEESAWIVEFTDEGGREIATAHVNLNKAQPKGRGNDRKRQPNLVTSYEVVG